MTMSNFSAKENTNVESKSKNDSGIQDESQKCEKFYRFLFIIRKHHSNKIIMAHINIKIILGINLICSQTVSLNT